MSSGIDSVSLNNAGVRLLLDGEVRESLVAFRRAVSSSRSVVEQQMQSIEVSGCDNSTFVAGFHLQAESISGLQNGYFFVYSRAFLLPVRSPDSCTMQTSDNPPEYGPLVYPYLLFNLALASHCTGKRANSPAVLARAGVVYDLLLRILRSGTWRTDHALDVLAIITLNNLAAMQYELGNHQDSMIRFQEMEDQLRVSDIYLSTYLVGGEADALRLNVEQARPPSSLAPAA